MSVFTQKCLYLGKVVVLEQSGCISENVVVFWAKVTVFGQKCLYSGKVVVFG